MPVRTIPILLAYNILKAFSLKHQQQNLAVFLYIWVIIFMKSTAKQIFDNKYYSIGLILLLTFGVYFNSLFNKYALDDFYVTAQNPEISEGILCYKNLNYLNCSFTYSAW